MGLVLALVLVVSIVLGAIIYYRVWRFNGAGVALGLVHSVLALV